MAHVLLRKRFDNEPGNPFSWVFYCECGKLFGGLTIRNIEHCAGDILDAHREHVMDMLGETPKLALKVMDPTSDLLFRVTSENERLHREAETRKLYEGPAPVLFTYPGS
jgi:hypothetical protein